MKTIDQALIDFNGKSSVFYHNAKLKKTAANSGVPWWWRDRIATRWPPGPVAQTDNVLPDRQQYGTLVFMIGRILKNKNSAGLFLKN